MRERAGTPWRGGVVQLALFAIGSSPFWTRFTSGVPGLGGLTRVFDAWFSFQCHRDAQRTLFFFGALLPVCARCVGIYAGLGLGAVIVRPRLGAPMTRLWVGFAALVMVLDVLTEILEMRPEWAPLRVGTGILLAYPVSVSLIRAARTSRPHEQL